MKATRSKRLLIAACTAWPCAASGQDIVFHIDGAPDASITDGFGQAFDAVPDLDGDGIEEIAVSANLATAGDRPGAGVVYVFSGADARLLFRVDGESVAEHFGSSLARIADLDGDGVDDLAVGAPLSSPPQKSEAGVVRLVSSATGITVGRIEGNTGDRLGTTILKTGDLDGDNVPDLFIQAGDPRIGAVYAYSLARRERLYATGSWNGLLDVCGDVDGDGVDDLVATRPTGETVILTGRDGSLLHSLVSEGGANAVAGVPDVDGDGVVDVVVAMGPGLTAFSGATGGPIYTSNGIGGVRLAGIEDVDGDGFGDIVESSPSAMRPSCCNRGTVSIISGHTGSAIYSLSQPCCGAETSDRIGEALHAVCDLASETRTAYAYRQFVTAPNGSRFVRVSAATAGRDPCRSGNAGARSGATADVLYLNGLTGSRPERRIWLGQSEPVQVAISSPPSRAGLQTRFSVFAWLGVPVPWKGVILPSGVGRICFPVRATGGTPQPSVIWNNIGGQMALGAPTRPSSLAPSVILRSPSGFRRPMDAVFQGLIRDDDSISALGYSVTNAILVQVR